MSCDAGIRQDANSGLLGNSHGCDPPLKPRPLAPLGTSPFQRTFRPVICSTRLKITSIALYCRCMKTLCVNLQHQGAFCVFMHCQEPWQNVALGCVWGWVGLNYLLQIFFPFFSEGTLSPSVPQSRSFWSTLHFHTCAHPGNRHCCLVFLLFADETPLCPTFRNRLSTSFTLTQRSVTRAQGFPWV